MKDNSFNSDITDEKLREFDVLRFCFNGDKQDIVPTTARRCQTDQRSQTNSHTYMLTGILVDETPDINSD